MVEQRNRTYKTLSSRTTIPAGVERGKIRRERERRKKKKKKGSMGELKCLRMNRMIIVNSDQGDMLSALHALFIS